ncbi:MAG: AN1-type zinc finger domain-containing protein [Candidatus Bathyarchaeia archaeon]|nr:hypothetical protein [Candidatus Bathyarchaeota archaeon]
MECKKCKREDPLPFRCPYCGGFFCIEHRLPENHECPGIERARPPRRPQLLTSPAQQHAVRKSYIYPLKLQIKPRFSSKEIKHLSIASLLILGIGLSMGLYYPGALVFQGLSSILAFAVLVLFSFIAHEFAHKFMAQREGLWAEFRLVFTGVLLTALSIISPIFKIIAPGAVFIAGFTNKQSMGKVSLSGPSVNIILSLSMLALWSIFKNPILSYGAAVNAWIAMINLLPFGVLDGYKILVWSKPIWVFLFAISLILTVTMYIII